MKKILGIPIVVAILGLLVIGSGAALLVKYFSNSVTHTVDVTSPLEMVGDTDLSIAVYGGNNIEYSVTTRNLADVDIESYPITEVTGPGSWIGNEFLEVWLEDNSGLHNATSLLYIVKDDGSLIPFTDAGTLDTTTLKLYFDNSATGTLHTYARPVGFVEQNNITVVTNPAIMPGTYTIKSCQLYDWGGTCP